MEDNMGDSPVSQVSPTEDDQEMGDISSLARKLDSEFDNAQQPETKNYDPNSDHMKVYLRMRPYTETEKKLDEDQGCYEINSIHTLSAHAPKESHTYKTSTHGLCKSTHKFTFSHIFPEETSQKEFFDETMLGTVKDFINGQNCLVFTYGVTNSGKTYTIQGNPKDGGILPRALDVVFNSIEGKHWDGMSIKPEMYCDVRRLSTRQEEIEIKTKECVLKLANDNDPDVGALLGPDAETSKFNIDSSGTMSEDSLMPSSDRQSTSSEVSKTEDCNDKDGDNKEAETLDNRIRDEGAVSVEDQGPIKFSIWVSFVEVYNEQIFDLLEPLPKKKKGRRTVLSLREDKNGSPYVKGVKEICVTSADEAYKVLTVGQKNLQMACTKMNHNSSRSHCIFNIKMVRVVDTHNPHMARVSMLSLCDLAGSERYTKTQSQGDRIKEAGNINTSLLTLGKCIKELRHNQHYKDHQRIVPFRESKLTRLFQSFLCGKGKASMIVNINMCASMFDETLYALKYSAVAKQVIVVQAPPPPPVENKKHKKSRAVSLALAPTPKGAVRPSISWATPRTMAQLAEIESEAAGVPLPIDEEEDELDTTLAASREQELQEMIQTLGDMLKEEKRKNVTMESRIREEVCKEMSQHIVEIEKTYNDMIEEERERAGRWADARVEMYMRSVKKKSTKRKKREDDEEEEEMVPLSQHNAQLARLQDQAGQIADLQDSLDNTKEEIKQLQDALKAAISERETAQGQLSQLKFEVANLKEVTEKSDSKALNKSLCELSQSEIVRSLTQQISQLKQELEGKIAENGELNEMLTEAGETFQAKEARIRTLEAQVAAGTPKKGRTPTFARLTANSSGFASDFSDCVSVHRRTIGVQTIESIKDFAKACNKGGALTMFDSSRASNHVDIPCTLTPLQEVQLQDEEDNYHGNASVVVDLSSCVDENMASQMQSFSLSHFQPAASSTMANCLEEAPTLVKRASICKKKYGGTRKHTANEEQEPDRHRRQQKSSLDDKKQTGAACSKSMLSNAARGSGMLAKHTHTSRMRLMHAVSPSANPAKRAKTDRDSGKSIMNKMSNALRRAVAGKKAQTKEEKRRSSVGVRTRARTKKR